MTRKLALVLSGLLLVGAHAPDEPDAPADGPRDCIDLSAVTNRTAEDGQTIRFDLIGGRSYVNRLAGRCPGLRDSSRRVRASATRSRRRRASSRAASRPSGVTLK